jgi:hypothetical protein
LFVKATAEIRWVGAKFVYDIHQPKQHGFIPTLCDTEREREREREERRARERKRRESERRPN